MDVHHARSGVVMVETKAYDFNVYAVGSDSVFYLRPLIGGGEDH